MKEVHALKLSINRAWQSMNFDLTGKFKQLIRLTALLAHQIYPLKTRILVFYSDKLGVLRTPESSSKLRTAANDSRQADGYITSGKQDV